MQKITDKKILVIGAGLAGSDAAWFLAQKGIQVVLLEAKTINPTPAQKLKTAAELVCTNSLKSLKPDSAHGVLKYEMNQLGSLVLDKATEHAVGAGDALAVDRESFSAAVEKALSEHPLIDLKQEEAANPIEAKKKYDCEMVIVATGPLTTKKLEDWIISEVSSDDLYFYDAIAPVVEADSLDFSKLYYKDRWKDNETEADYLNAPMDKDQYESFVAELKAADKVPAANFEEYKFFESCLPIDIMAERGDETLRFSCMKPVGLRQNEEHRPYAVIQLRKENLQGESFNLVGFQNRLTYSEQLRVFRMIPGFENATFAKLGSVHRNTFLNAKKVLNWDLSLKQFPSVFMAGQICGVEGYTESASMGLYAAFQVFRRLTGKDLLVFPEDTAMGALVRYIHTSERPAPSNINFGLLPTIKLSREQRRGKMKKVIKKQLAANRAKESMDTFWSEAF